MQRKSHKLWLAERSMLSRFFQNLANVQALLQATSMDYRDELKSHSSVPTKVLLPISAAKVNVVL
jgi:hypothetical protein